MRLLSVGIENDILDQFNDVSQYIIDEVTEFDDALYHLSVRFYNLVLIKSDSLKECLSLLKTTFNTITAFVIVTNNSSKEFELKLLKNGAISVIKKPFDTDLFMAKIESIHRDNFKEVLYYNDYFGVNHKEREIIDNNNQQIKIRGKAYEILSYLIKNKNRPPISKEELIYALWEDPEMVSDNIIEVNMNQIRSKLRDRFSKDFIETVRNRGYRLKNQ
jgi:two-component system OmpR family response regulator